MQLLTTLPILIPPTSCSGSHSSLTSFSCTYPVAKYVNSNTDSNSSHNFFSCPTASQIPPSHFLHVKCFENIGGTHFTLARQQLIHLPHCTQNTELTFTFKQQIPHVSTLLLDETSFVVVLLTITLAFHGLTFKPSIS